LSSPSVSTSRGDGAGHGPWWRALSWRALLSPEVSLPLILLTFCVYLSIASPYFLLWQNFMNILASVSVIGIAAAFATLVVISAGVDLTPVAVMTAVGIVSLHTLNNGWSVTATVIACLVVAAALGAVNGILVSFIALNPFITTLGTNFIFTGVAYVVTSGQSQLLVGHSSDSFLQIGEATVGPQIPVSALIMLATFTIAFVMLRYTRFGTHVFAVGGDEKAARLNGVRVRRAKLFLYVLAAASAGVAGIVLAAQSGSVAPYAATSQTNLLLIIAAVIIGGTALEGGRGSVVGTFVGVLLVGVIQDGLVLLNVSSFYQPVVTGGVLVIALLLDKLQLALGAES
jgi:ribose/xylose/arabinose/galactoside ABC-type transport system permease subunit